MIFDKWTYCSLRKCCKWKEYINPKYAICSNKKYTPDDVNIYAIDFSSKILGVFAEAPHMGGVMYENDLDKIDKFFHMLKQMLQDRKNILKETINNIYRLTEQYYQQC